jgi:Ca-activated chloride channel family protein
MMNFANPYLLLLIPLALALLVLAMRRRKAFGHSQIKNQKDLRTFSITGYIPAVLLGSFLVLLGLAVSRPVVPEYHDISVTQTRDFCLAVDISGSMTTNITDPDQMALAQAARDAAKAAGDSTGTGTSTAAAAEPKPLTRLNVAQSAINDFVKTREGDRVCLMYFDDDTYYSWPLTSDLNTIIKRNKRTSGYSGGGTNFEGPTENDRKNGPIQAGINHFKEFGQAKSKVIIIVSDGESTISEKRYTELLNQMKGGSIKLYVLGIGEGWVGDSPSTQDLRRLAKESGGEVMVVGNAADMRTGVAKIDSLEKSRVEIATSVSFKDVYWMFLIAALIAGLLYFIAASVVREDV